MSIELFIYMAGIVGNIKGVIVLTAIVTFILSVIWGIASTDKNANSERKKERANICNKLAIATFVTAINAALLPNERTMYMMLGARAGVGALQSETASKIRQIIDKKLDEYVQQLGGDKK